MKLEQGFGFFLVSGLVGDDWGGDVRDFCDQVGHLVCHVGYDFITGLLVVLVGEVLELLVVGEDGSAGVL